MASTLYQHIIKYKFMYANCFFCLLRVLEVFGLNATLIFSLIIIMIIKRISLFNCQVVNLSCYNCGIQKMQAAG